MKVHTLESLKHCERAQSAFVQLHVRKTRDPLILTHQRDLPSFQALQYLIRLGHEHLPVERDRSERIWPTRPPLFPLNGRLVPPQRSLGLYKNTTECFHTHLQSFQDLLRLDSERQKLKTHLCLWTMDHVWDIWPFWAVTGKVHLQKHFKWTAEEEFKLVTEIKEAFWYERSDLNPLQTPADTHMTERLHNDTLLEMLYTFKNKPAIKGFWAAYSFLKELLKCF